MNQEKISETRRRIFDSQIGETKLDNQIDKYISSSKNLIKELQKRIKILDTKVNYCFWIIVCLLLFGLSLVCYTFLSFFPQKD